MRTTSDSEEIRELNREYRKGWRLARLREKISLDNRPLALQLVTLAEDIVEQKDIAGTEKLTGNCGGQPIREVHC